MITFIKRFFITLFVLIIFIVIGLYLTGNQYLLKAVRLTYLKGEITANIDDYVDFDTRMVEAGEIQTWRYSDDFNKVPLTNILEKELTQLKTAGFLVVKNGEIITEKYFGEYNEKSLTNSFSVAKTFTTMLLGKAIEDGFIENINQSIVDYLPEYKNDSLAKLCTIGDLSAMTAGFDWDENYYLPLNVTTKAYYGDNINQQMFRYCFNSISGKKYEYKSGSTQLLGIIISRATGKKLSDYLSEKFWKPLGMEVSAPWSLDQENGMEKAHCCVSARLRDFAKMGQLLLQNGKWKNVQLLDSAFVNLMTTPNTINGKVSNPSYGYGIWTDYKHNPKMYSMVGHLGQKVICIPSENIVIVRTGNLSIKEHTKGNIPGLETYTMVEEVLKMLDLD